MDFFFIIISCLSVKTILDENTNGNEMRSDRVTDFQIIKSFFCQINNLVKKLKRT